ncbi:GAF domain-containing sensor histidine kinase [Pseudomonas stutzeri]|uniref:histidine kinase n=1 Tax=Stutzerimonas stutzeri TaxID=316 RepID=A0A2N8S4G4_STUST|nr:GAF domain-containing sensor histidine kinase [Stutzerimonas stutzeri]MCQ4294082.1 GAF domain-containing sensor histidine kinase [Stutzerimonas stutzeri]PNF81523.1 histidine kinase [Stutzerimonas stutzeri]
MVQSILDDLLTVQRISAVPAILQVVSETTGLRFAAVARVTETSWTACAVLDRIEFGLKVGGELDVTTTLCSEIHTSQQPIIISQVSADPDYCDHHTPRMYGFESYISVPVLRVDGSFFGTLCALDPLPCDLSSPTTRAMFESFARLLTLQIDAEEQQQATRAALSNERTTGHQREQFIALLGHDLRTPLASILAASDLLVRRSSEPGTQQLAEHVRASSQRASRMVDDLLDFARGQLGNGIPLNWTAAANLHLTLLQVVNELRTAHPRRVLLERLPELELFDCDPDRIAQLLANLITNALHHGASTGPVIVTAQTHDSRFELTVHNCGTPIPPERLERLFHAYSQEDDTSRNGLGLGLFIVDQVAQAHGGSMHVSSSAEAGTTFTFSMPIRRD